MFIFKFLSDTGLASRLLQDIPDVSCSFSYVFVVVSLFRCFKYLTRGTDPHNPMSILLFSEIKLFVRFITRVGTSFDVKSTRDPASSILCSSSS